MRERSDLAKIDALAPVDPEATESWWRRDDLRYINGRLTLGDCDLATAALKLETPLYVLRGAKVIEKIVQLHQALHDAGVDHRIYYAIKANRSPQLLSFLSEKRIAGADVCSPEELKHALACGFREEDISFTGTSLSARDFDDLARFDCISLNLDSLSALERFGTLCPGREIGIRINPDRGISYTGNDMLKYSGCQTTKFGIYLDSFDDALAIAKRHALRVVRLHFHAGSGYLNEGLGDLQAILTASHEFMHHLPNLKEVNIGGGLGVPHRCGDRPLDLHSWADVLAKAFADRGVRIALEPGDFLVKEAGVLLTTVTYRERRKQTEFIGVDAGFNLAMEPAFYSLPCHPVPTVPRPVPKRPLTVVGNINEALDKWAVEHEMPPPEEGDVIALINAGGYAASMRSDHCMRGGARELYLHD
ncbi:diaminopimelate decarboxylase (plasmid) [Rhizobium lusitanum]|uniref:diaminopimelate decarboxylase n=1 Tax=Rhizobium lusitanum TaxID=293958 RepID=UPI00161DF49C|nr:diaminopimelate decarboxylase [Rhizobium lusitanum]QND44763.1 diaminopimelate decarboxylase [Rhizobium lusitanum]